MHDPTRVPRPPRRVSRRATLARLGIAGLALAAPLGAGEFRLALDAEVGARSYGDYRNADADGERADVGTAGLALELGYLGTRVELAGGYRPSFQRLLQDSSSDATTHALELGLVGHLGHRTELTLHERLHQGEQLDLVAAVEPETLGVGRGDQLRHAFAAGLEHRASERWRWRLEAEQRVERWDERDFADAETMGAGGSVFWSLRPQRAIGLHVGARRSHLDGRHAGDVLLADSSYSADVGRNGRLRVVAGAFRLDQTGVGGAADSSRSGWRGSLSANGRHVAGGWHAGYRREVTTAGGLGQFVTIDQLNGGLAMGWWNRLDAGLSASYSRAEALTTRDERLDLLAVHLHGDLRILDRLWLTAGVSWLDQSSGFAGLDDLGFARYRIGLRMSLIDAGDARLVTATQAVGEEWHTLPSATTPGAAAAEPRR
jgi:hypothetical protein